MLGSSFSLLEKNYGYYLDDSPALASSAMNINNNNASWASC